MEIAEIIAESTKKFQAVNGIEVTSVEAALSPLSGHDSVNGMEVHYKKAVRLNLADGTTMYGCSFGDCLYTNAHVLNVTTKHSRAHVRTVDPRFAQFLDWTLDEVIARLLDNEDDLNRVVAQRDKAIAAQAALRTRVKELETEVSDLAKLRKLLNKGAK